MRCDGTEASSSIGGRDICRLIRFAADSLKTMQRPDGLYCLERVRQRGPAEGLSLRYSLMVLLGLTKGEQTGLESGLDTSALETELLDRVESPDLKAGDIGLYLWADARRSSGRSGMLLPLLEKKLAADGLDTLEGMEVAWIIIGLANTIAADGDAAASSMLKRALAQLLEGNASPSGLFHHHGTGDLRRRFPNFATQIYGVLALSETARLELDRRALDAARRAADVLLRLQLTDGGWPWIFDADRGRVVERYEVYSVHQDAMAPMGLLSLAEVSGERTYADAALRGLGWIYGNNEVGADMIDRDTHMIYRSIRRTKPWDRLVLVANTASSRFIGRPLRSGALKPEINTTCRPYHLGWILEAWCGREKVSVDNPQSLSTSTSTMRSAARPSQSGTVRATP